MSLECTTDESRNNLAAEGISGNNFFFFSSKFLNDSENEFLKFILNFQMTLFLLEVLLIQIRSWHMEREKVEPEISFSLNKPCWEP